MSLPNTKMCHTPKYKYCAIDFWMFVTSPRTKQALQVVITQLLPAEFYFCHYELNIPIKNRDIWYWYMQMIRHSHETLFYYTVFFNINEASINFKMFMNNYIHGLCGMWSLNHALTSWNKCTPRNMNLTSISSRRLQVQLVYQENQYWTIKQAEILYTLSALMRNRMQ